MRRCSSKFVANEVIDPSFTERNRVFLASDPLHHFRNLPFRRIQSDPVHVLVRIDLCFICKAPNKLPHRILKARSAGYDHAKRYCPISMQSFEIFQIAIKEGIFVVPLYFERNRAGFKVMNVIDFMRLCFTLDTIDDALNNKFVLPPAVLFQGSP